MTTTGDWQGQLASVIDSVAALADCLSLTPAEQRGLERVVARYPLRVTPYYLGLSRERDDAIWRQCVPSVRELNGDGCADPFRERDCCPAPGVIHRYPDRALLTANLTCAVNCRHCTRKNLLRDGTACGQGERLDAAVAAIRAAPSVREVIVSGGDPLLLETDVLDRLLGALRAIPHVDVLRVGTRLPVVLPMRIDAELCAVLSAHRPLWVNTQFNHPVEMTDQAAAACERLLLAGIPVSNQAVLLRGVNDDIETLSQLCTLLQCRMVRPYYVFVGDPVKGTTHFRTPVRDAVGMEAALRSRLGGLAVPRFVADVPGAPGKVPVTAMAEEAGHADGAGHV